MKKSKQKKCAKVLSRQRRNNGYLVWINHPNPFNYMSLYDVKIIGSLVDTKLSVKIQPSGYGRSVSYGKKKK